MLTNTFVVPVTVSGTIAVAAGALQYPVPVAADLVRVVAKLGTAGTTQPLLVDVNKNAVTVWTNQANRLSIAANATAGSVQPALDANNGVNQIAPTVTQTPAIATFAAGDTVSVDVDQFGTSAANLVVMLEFKAK